jgi:general secretion pathway protein N
VKRILFIGVFMVVLAVSFLWHLPAGWVWQQVHATRALPPNLQVTDLDGVWWQGSARVSWRQGNETLALGNWQWAWRPSALFSGQIGLDVVWAPVKQSVSATVLWDGEQLTLDALSGRLGVADFAGVVPKVGPLLVDAGGEIVLNKVAAEIAINRQAWPKIINGDVSVRNLQVLGVNVPSLKIHPSMAQKQVRFGLTGGGDGWRLSGQTELNPNRTYRSQLKIEAETAKRMPDWVSMVLPVKSPVLAESDQTGRW